jgi:[protein-PII] uridylyltransferase
LGFGGRSNGGGRRTSGGAGKRGTKESKKGRRKVMFMKGRPLRRSDLPELKAGGGRDSVTFFAGEIKNVYNSYLDDLKKRHREGASGLEIARDCSDSVEIIINHLFSSLKNYMGKEAGKVPALVALGGFGRRELSPRSDVDIMFLWGRGGGHYSTGFAGYLVRLMWDSGLKLGHSVRTMLELKKALKKDLDLKTALLDGRWICGDRDLRGKLSQIKDDIRNKERGVLLKAKLDETRERWKRFGGSYHLIEPNVKESPGGLRDYQTIRWLGEVLPWKGKLEGLYRLAIVDRQEIRDIRRAFDFLVRTRNEIHLQSNSDNNVLTVEIQETVARDLGYREKDNLLTVEHFMRDYYSNTRSVYSVIERILDETHGRGNLRVIDGALYKRVGTKGLGRLNLRLRRDKMKEDPLFMFKEQLITGRRFSPHMDRRVREVFREKYTDPESVGRMRRSFIELLQMEGKKEPVIRNMHELGVLSRIFPVFEGLTCLKKQGLYHQYTADEHSLQAISHLEELSGGEDGLLHYLYQEVGESLELLLAVILHDIGKVGATDHARGGAKMASKILKSFPLSTSSRSQVVFLVRNHLLLSHFAQRRDMEDRDTCLQFIKRIRNSHNLKLLYLLTYADLKATGTGVWTSWKENLFEGLYYRAIRLLTEEPELKAGYGRVFQDKQAKLFEACSNQEERDRMEAHLKGLPPRYQMVVSPSRVKAHLAMLDELKESTVVMDVRELEHSIEVTICTKDTPFRLSQLCGAITINDLNILGAYAFTRVDGKVIDIFNVIGVNGDLSFHARKWTKLESDLKAVLESRIDLEKAYVDHVKKWKRTVDSAARISYSVEFENELSGKSTVIDVTANDRPGLLYRLTRALSEEGLDIQSAQITTQGRKIADSFYVTTSEGDKLTDPSAIKKVRAHLSGILEKARDHVIN